MKPKFKRILLKLSGETLSGEGGSGIDVDTLKVFAKEICEIHGMGIDVALVLGGGNIFRGASNNDLERTTGDYMGMMATLINCLAFQAVIEKQNIHSRVMSAINVSQIAEPYIRRRAIRHLEKNRIVLFAAGTGNPYFSTDTAAALRTMEIDADVLIKGTKVDGVFNSDPKKNTDAKRFDHLTPMDFINKRLGVLDTTAVSLCMDNKVPIVVFNFFEPGNLKKLVQGEPLGTWIHADERK
jgi:uridylate kinase